MHLIQKKKEVIIRITSNFIEQAHFTEPKQKKKKRSEKLMPTAFANKFTFEIFIYICVCIRIIIMFSKCDRKLSDWKTTKLYAVHFAGYMLLL